jgi:hypothetical protein
MPTKKTASGQTRPGRTNWKDYYLPEGSDNIAGIYVDVDTSGAKFTKTPVYVTSLGGADEHWKTTGATSIYQATPKGFRVYIRWAPVPPPSTLTAALANQNRWHINWIGMAV